MKQLRFCSLIPAILVCGTTAISPAHAQELTPLDEGAAQPLSTPAISESDVELFGKLAHLWTLPDATEVIQFYGEFSLHVGPRRISSRDAVVWMTADQYEGRPFHRFDVFAWQDARVVEPGGSVTSGPVLLVTLQSFGRVSVSFDARTDESSAESALYQRADRVRRRLSPFRKPLYAHETPLEVQQLAAQEGQPVGTQVRPPTMIRPGKKMTSLVHNGRRLLVAGGGVYIARGAASSEEFLEIRARDAVFFARESALQDQIRLGLEDRQAPSQSELERALQQDEPDLVQELPDSPQGIELGAVSDLLSAVYLEGDVILSRGRRTIRASRLFYDFDNERALILDAVMFAPVPSRNLPIYVRAAEVRQLSSREYVARHALISTSEFHTPHYAIGAEKVFLQDRTLGPPDARVSGLVAGTYKAYHSTIQIEGVPVAYWPFSRGDFKQSESILKGVAIGYRDDFGASVETEWYLSSLLGLDSPDGFDSTLLLDYFSDRGPAGGINLDYTRDDYFGLLRGYYIDDRGDDQLGGLRNNIDVPHDDRGRVLWRHRQYLPRDWELTLEVSYISDANFLESYFENEFDREKEQETLIYLKKQQDNWAVTALAKWQLLGWIETTEALPDIAFHWIGQPVGPYLTYFNESRVGAVRRRTDKRLFFESDRIDNLARTDVTARGDTRHEIDAPLSLGPLKVVPFAVIRGTAWDGDEPAEDGSTQRIFGQYGLRSSAFLWRTFPDAQSDLFDIHGLRHIIKPDLTAWIAHANRDSRDITPFSPGIEDIDDFNGVTLGIRQRLQTKRGPPEDRRIADWMTLDIEAGFFDADNQPREFTRGWISHTRPEESITSNYLSADYIWRISDSTALLSDVILDLNSGDVGSLNVSIAVERTPRFSYFLAYRFIGHIDSNLLGIGANYRISRKHTIAIREYFDLDRGQNGGLQIAYIRKFPRWYVGITLEIDDVQDRTGISLSAWPEGLPSIAIGGRRYTGVAESVAIRE